MKKFKSRNVLFEIFLFVIGGLTLKAGQVQVYTTQGEQIVDFPGGTLSVDWLHDTGIYGLDIVGITVLDSVTKIDRGAFVFYPRLTNVTIQNSLTEIDESAFAFCFRLTSVTIQGSVTKIGRGAFMGCSSLTSVDIKGSVGEICWRAFAYCRNLINLTILGPIERVGFSVFEGCPLNEEYKALLLEKFGSLIF